MRLSSSLVSESSPAYNVDNSSEDACGSKVLVSGESMQMCSTFYVITATSAITKPLLLLLLVQIKLLVLLQTINLLIYVINERSVKTGFVKGTPSTF